MYFINVFFLQVNESLLAMSFVDNDRDILDNKVISDNLNNGDNVIGNNEEGCDNKGESKFQILSFFPGVKTRK